MLRLTCLLFLLISLPALAQSVYQPVPVVEEPGLVTVGLRGGANLSSVVGRDVSDTLSRGGSAGMKPGLMLGLNITSRLKPTFWLQHELWLQGQGAALQLRDENGQAYRSKLRLTYLTLFPANVTLVRRNWQFYAGPYFSMGLSASIQRRDPAGNLYTDPSVFGSARVLTNYVSKIDAGLVAGVDYAFRDRWTLGLRLQRGVLPIWNENTLSQNGQARIYNQSGTLNVGYRLSR